MLLDNVPALAMKHISVDIKKFVCVVGMKQAMKSCGELFCCICSLESLAAAMYVLSSCAEQSKCAHGETGKGEELQRDGNALLKSVWRRWVGWPLIPTIICGVQ